MFHSINIGISTFISAGWKNDSLTILRKMNFLKGQLDRKKESLPPTEAYQKVYLQQKFPAHTITWEFVYKSRTEKSQNTTKNSTEWDC